MDGPGRALVLNLADVGWVLLSEPYDREAAGVKRMIRRTV